MDWASKKAEELCWTDSCRGDPKCANCRAVAAALREAREQGLAEGREQGAREEREACYEVVTLTFAQFRGAQAPVVERRVSDAIAARGPMSEGGERG